MNEPTIEQVQSTLQTLTPATITRTYSGSPGCCCGCQGTYREGLPATTRALARFRRLASEMHQGTWDLAPTYVAYETSTRLNILYLD